MSTALPTPAHDEARPLAALLWMIGASLSFTALAVAGRELSVEMNTFELMLYRSVIGFFVICAFVARSKRGFSQVRTSQFGRHVLRNVFHYAGQNLWFWAVTAIALGQMVALEFTNPLWVALMAPLMLGEALTRTRLLAAALGFLGVLIVARPGFAPIELGHAAALGAAIGFALNTIFTRGILARDTVLCVLFWMTLLQSGASFALSLPGGIPWPSLQALPWIVVVGLCGLTAHVSLTSALEAAPATLVAPMEFVRLPMMAFAGALIYGEPIETAVFIGAAVIIAANLVNLRGSRRRSRAPLTPPAG